MRALSDLEVVPKSSVSVGDRYGVDIEPALGLGMGGILVASITEVYGLPSYLESELGKS